MSSVSRAQESGTNGEMGFVAREIGCSVYWDVDRCQTTASNALVLRKRITVMPAVIRMVS